MTCALYFGSFNPLHYGHIAIARYLIEKCNVDQVRLVLSPKNPLKDAKVLSSPEIRLKNLRDEVAHLVESGDFPLGKIEVSDIEFHLPTPLYTINTLLHFKENETDKRFILIIGGDNIAIIEDWHRWRDLLEMFEVWVYPRRGYYAEALCHHYSALSSKIKLRFLAEAPLYDISSTEIREGIGN